MYTLHNKIDEWDISAHVRFAPWQAWPLCPTCSSFALYHLYNMSLYRSRLLFSQLIKHTCLLRNESYLVPLLSVKRVHWTA